MISPYSSKTRVEEPVELVGVGGELGGGVEHGGRGQEVTVEVDNQTVDAVKRQEPVDVGRAGDDGRLDAFIAEGALHEPVEVDGEDDPDPPGGDQAGDRPVCGRGLLPSGLAVLVVGNEEAGHELLAFGLGGGDRIEEPAVGGRLPVGVFVPSGKVILGDFGAGAGGETGQ